jgi:hypothetical protein
VPFAGLAGGAIQAPSFGADVPQSTACGFVIAVGLQIGCKLVAEAVGRDRLLVLGPQAVRQAAYLYGQIDGTPDLREHPWFRLGVQQFVDDNDQGVRIIGVIGNRAKRLALRIFDLGAPDAEMDQQFAWECQDFCV